MKIRLCLLVLLLTSVAATILAQGPHPKKPRTPADYTPRTLKQLMTLQPDPIEKDENYQRSAKDPMLRIVVHGDLLPSRVKVSYEGMTRPLHEDRKSLIKRWANQYAGAPEFYTTPYQTEALFAENGENYWLAVRTDSLSTFDRELKKGEAVELYVIKMGNIRIDDKMEPVLLVENYVKQ